MNTINSKRPKKGSKNKHFKKETDFDENIEGSKTKKLPKQIQKPTKIKKEKVNKMTDSDSYTIAISLQRGYQPFTESYPVNYDLTTRSEISEVEIESSADLYRSFYNSYSTGKYTKYTIKQKPWWLYDTGSTDHIYWDRKLFTSFEENFGQLGTIATKGRPVSPTRSGTVRLKILVSDKPRPIYQELVLKDILYLPDFDINIISELKHYQIGGVLQNRTLYGRYRKLISFLNLRISRFFLILKDIPIPKEHIQKENKAISYSSQRTEGNINTVTYI